MEFFEKIEEYEAKVLLTLLYSISKKKPDTKKQSILKNHSQKKYRIFNLFLFKALIYINKLNKITEKNFASFIQKNIQPIIKTIK